MAAVIIVSAVAIAVRYFITAKRPTVMLDNPRRK